MLNPAGKVFFCNNKKCSTLPAMGMRQFLKRDPLVDSFQQKRNVVLNVTVHVQFSNRPFQLFVIANVDPIVFLCNINRGPIVPFVIGSRLECGYKPSGAHFE